MPERINYYKEMEAALQRLEGHPRLLLHSCCGPCSSAVLELLTAHFDLTLFYYNPNIYPEAEYALRLATQKKLLTAMFPEGNVKMTASEYRPADFDAAIRGLESEPEGGARCGKCFALRLEETAKAAVSGGFAYFTTTLTVSPHKNADVINELGLALGGQYGVPFLPSDFKKRDGYRRSVALANEYALYRQSYCGCRYSENHN